MKGNKQIAFLKALQFMHFGGKAVILPYLPLFLREQSFSSVEIGTIMGVAPLISIVAQPFVGFVSDKYKTIKYLLIIMYMGVIAASFGVFFQENFWIVFLSFLLFHFALSPCTPLIDSMTIKTLGPDRKQYGKIRLWGSIGFALTAITSGPILMLAGIGNLYLLLWASTLLTVFLVLFLKNTRQSSNKVSLRGIGEILRNAPFLTFLLLCLLIIIPHRTNDTMLVLHLEHLGAAATMIGMAWGFAAISEVPVFYFLSKRVMDYHPLLLLGVIASLYTIRWLLYGLIDSPAIITLLQFSQGITFGLFWLVALQTTVSYIPDHLRSTGQAILTSVCFGLGGALGGTVGGSIFDHFGSSVLYQLMALVTFGAVILIVFHYRAAVRPKTSMKVKHMHHR
ncbi:MFS transporter [Thalassobacillus pellis]|uniref:MFS transporter n=1 Tax=Thalassobacillus pellis TaxID=748008 RepID=UPI0019609D33|nr:MFS transporter [Thalassobacillus pellis]MBM7553151.1 PPP family 3-phenylpropionic acid transporter [Thalassobacillus pellis]